VRASNLADKLGPVLDGFSNPIHMTLTIKSRRRLADADKHLRESWKKLYRAKAWRSSIVGGVVAEEVTHNTEHGFHAHLHLLVDGYIDQRLLADLWERCTGDSRIVYVSYIRPEGRAKALREALKYPFKLGDLVGDADLVAETLEYFKGRRTLWTFGSCYGLDAIDDDDLDDKEAETADSECCPHCGEHETMQALPFRFYQHRTVEMLGGWYLSIEDVPHLVVIRDKPPPG
jgi:hypothetical protein